MAKRDIIAIGGSAGSGAVLKRMMEQLPPDIPASLFITTHVPSTHPSYLGEMLASAGGLPVSQALDGQPVESGRAYVAAQDRHLLIEHGFIRLGAGPRENLVRPAIDPMFRSAALSYGSRAVGVVLTGMLNDGASGLAAIKQMGGTAVVQHPLDAHVDEMPRAALESVDADHVVRADELASLIADLARTDAGPSAQPTEDLRARKACAGSPIRRRSPVRTVSASFRRCGAPSSCVTDARSATPTRPTCWPPTMKG